MKISPARMSAFEILRKIETEGAFSANLLPEYEANLSSRDAALTHEIVLGVLRRQLPLDQIITAHSSKMRKLDTEIRIALRLGLYQLHFLSRVPAHSAINESVELVKFAKKRSAASFVNAVLRSASGHDLSFESEMSHPQWLLEKWASNIGQYAAEALAKANNRAPRLAFRLTSKGRKQETNLVPYAESEITRGCFFTERMDDNLREMAADGLIYFQDEGSQIIANSIELADGAQFLDVCASPGGKATAVALRHPDSTTLAGDLTARRVETLKSVMARQGSNVSVLRYDAEKSLPFASHTFDAVLVDAPCTGTGTIRHNPEIRYRVSPEDLERLPILQRQILDNAADLVRRGGSLIYTTCSLEPEENEQVVEAFIAERCDFEIVRPNVRDEFIGENLTARTWPHLHDMDGFFLTAMRRR